MTIRYYLDPETGEPHVYNHGVSEEEVELVLKRGWDVHPGRGDSRIVYGMTEDGRYLAVVYAPGRHQPGIFVITAYDLKGKALAAHRRRGRKRRRRKS